MKRALKEFALSSGLYGPLRKTYRQFLDPVDMRQFRASAAFYAAFISPGDLCFDIGSNVGEKAEVFLHLGARVVAFEPLLHCTRELGARCLHNKRLTVVQSAVGATIGSAQMYVGKWSKVSSLMSSWVRDQDLQETITVPVTTLDQAIQQFGTPAFCKIDVEGYEMEVLSGLSHSIPMLTLEYHLTDAGIQKTRNCVDYLSRFGSLSINITARETTVFLWPEWVDRNQFNERFPIAGPLSNFGDLFVRID